MTSRSRLVVVGNGMAGARFVEDVIARGGNQIFDISVFGDEPHGNYNRILLSGVLAGTHRLDDIVINPLSWYAANGVRLHAGNRVERLDLVHRQVIGGNDLVEPYDSLVIATGSRPLVPPIDGLVSDDGTLKDGAFVFRTIDDCDRMLRRAQDARAAVVIGGGLLGIEAARGLRNHGLDVHIVHLTPHVMDAQLDPPASRILQRQLEQVGIQILTNHSTTALLGHGRVAGVLFADGSTLACDMVVVAAGIRPNIQLAQAAGLAVKRGILIGDDLTCQGVEGVYAIGECAEHRGQLYGLVAPLWEQARILSDRLMQRGDALYAGSRLSTKLKVAGLDVAVMGLRDAIDDDDEVVSYAEPSRGIYKKLIIRNDKLVGAILMGDGPVVPGLAQAFADETALADRRSELLFPPPFDVPLRAPEQMADDTQICDCNVVSKAQIVDAVLRGASSLQAVCERTRAGTGCGSCRPEVQRIIEMSRLSVEMPELLISPQASPSGDASTPDENDKVVVTLNKVERIKKEKDGLDIIPDIPSLAQGPWEAITEGDRERLKWAGVFFRRQTPGQFMIRLRIPNGFTNADQVGAIAGVAEEFGTPLIDITTRQQIQIRGFAIEHVPEIGRRLEAVGLLSLQTGMDNIRNVIGCAAAGLTPGELFDASPVVHEFTNMFVGNKAFTNLPRKFNVGISGCIEHCTHAESQDLALSPAVKTSSGQTRHGFNVAVGGKMGSGGCKIAAPLDIFVEPAEAADVCREIVLLFRDHGSRAARNRARLSFLLEKWGADRFRRELEQRLTRTLEPAGRDARIQRGADHIGIHKQKQAGLNYAGLLVAVGRVAASTLREVARVATKYGTGDIRFTTTQNIIIPHVPDAMLSRFRSEPLLANLPVDPPGALRGLVACTGIDYCHFALIETKEIAVKTAEILATRLPHGQRVTTHWSGCPAGCGNHAAADIGLLGKNVRVNGEMVEAVDIFIGGRAGPNAKAAVKMLEDVPCADLPAVLETLIPYVTGKRAPVPSAAIPSSLASPDHANA